MTVAAAKKTTTKILALYLDEIHPDFNIRDGWDAEEVDDRYLPGIIELRESILTQGFKASKPVEVYKKDGKYILSEGNRRLAACKSIENYQNHHFSPDLSPGTIWAVEVPQPTKQQLIINQITSNISEECTPFDLSKAAALLMSDESLADEDGLIVTQRTKKEELIARLLGLKTRQMVKFHLALQDLAPALKRIVVEAYQNKESTGIAITSIMRILVKYGAGIGNTAISTAFQESSSTGNKITFQRLEEIAESLRAANKKQESSQAEEQPEEVITTVDADEVVTIEAETIDSDEDLTPATATTDAPTAKQELAANRKSRSETGLLLDLGRLGKKIYVPLAETATSDNGLTAFTLKEEDANELLELLAAIDELDLK
jgi:hypothetical protein